MKLLRSVSPIRDRLHRRTIRLLIGSSGTVTSRDDTYRGPQPPYILITLSLGNIMRSPVYTYHESKYGRQDVWRMECYNRTGKHGNYYTYSGECFRAAELLHTFLKRRSQR